MKKRILLVLTVLTMLLCVPLIANAASVDDLTFDAATGTITKCNRDAEGEFVIPEEIGGVKVTSIGKYAFDHCTTLTNVTIPNSVTNIGMSAFQNCGSLTSITIPDSVTHIGNFAFIGCDGLKDVHISDIAKWCEIDFDSSDSNPIYYADNLYVNGVVLTTDLVIPNGVTSIGNNAFWGCEGLTSVTIPDSVTSIGYDAFWGCESLTNVTIPDSVTSIGNDAFEGTAYYNNDYNWENGVLYIGNFLISAKNQELSGNYKINTGTKVIAGCAFEFCDRLTNIMIPDSVTSIGDVAFYGCSSLTSATIPDSVTSIGRGAFDSCGSLTDVYYSGSKADWNQIAMGEYNDPLLDATIHYNYIKYDPITPVALTVTPSGNSYVLTAETDYDGDAYAAAYDAESALISVVSEPFADGTATVVPDTAGAAKIKFFVWTNTLQPVTLAEEITLN